MFNKDLSIIAPCYNEENNIPELVKRLIKTTEKISLDAEIILINDGSKDNTDQVIQKMVEQNNGKVIGFSNKKNLGIEESWRNGLKKLGLSIRRSMQHCPNIITNW